MARQHSFCDSACLPTKQRGKFWLSGGSPLCRDKAKDPEQPRSLFGLPYEWNFPYELPLGSPDESYEGNSNETMSENDDDYTAGLAEKIAHSMLDDDDTTTETNLNNKPWGYEHRRSWADVARKASSPQSTLPGIGSWSICGLNPTSPASSAESSAVSSPLSPFSEDGDTWNLFSPEIGKGVKMNADKENRVYEQCFPPLGGKWVSKQQGQLTSSHNQVRMDLLNPNVSKQNEAKLTRFPTSTKDTNLKSAHQLYNTLNDKMRAEESNTRGYKLRVSKHGSDANWGHPNRSVQQGMASTRNGQCPAGTKVSSSSSPAAQPAGRGSGLRAVFLQGNVLNRESVGTGVFFPRHVGSGSSYDKKRHGFTVLLPSRIVESLNLNINDVSCPLLGPAQFTQVHIPRDFASPVAYPSTNRPDLPEVCKYSKCTYLSDISLPSEWTY